MKKRNRRKPAPGQMVILTAVVLVNLFALGLGMYFFYDQVVATTFDLKSPQRKLEQAVTIVTSGLREPYEQIEAIDRIEQLRGEVSPDLYHQAVTTIDRALPRMTIAAEVIDHWIAVHHRRPSVPGYDSAVEVLADWQADDLSRSAARQRYWMQWKDECTPQVEQLLRQTMGSSKVPEIERQIAAQVFPRWHKNCSEALVLPPPPLGHR